ncbi:hypothetical protein [Streptomyces sp. NPDC002994]|uniref:hypothetical protein n=1 Tax=Streptomyces sp. NPDC002994 TaxID=3154441 RepID=UPI0033BDDC21
MNPTTRVTSTTVWLDGGPDEIHLHIQEGGHTVLQIGNAITVHLGFAPTETLLAVAAALTQAAEQRAPKAVAA